MHMNPKKAVKQELLHLFANLCENNIHKSFIDEYNSRKVALYDSHSSYYYLNGVFQDIKMERENFLKKLEARIQYFQIQDIPFSYWLNDELKLTYETEELQKAGFCFEGLHQGVYLDYKKFSTYSRPLPEGYVFEKIDVNKSFSTFEKISQAVFANEEISFLSIYRGIDFYPDCFHNYVLRDSEGSAVACITVFLSDKTIGLHFAGVIPSMRRKGLFSYLLSYVLNQYKDLDYSGVCSVFENNALGSGSLKAAGFEYTQEFYLYSWTP
ncbi:MAG: GNAT family N-acetyltransferase [Bacteroidales bacterium]